MIRAPLAQSHVGHEDGFRWRGHEVSRLEGFSDAVFGFALTLLVVSLEVPRTFEELLMVIRSFPGFAVCFLLFLQIWFRHYLFFRRYGLEDRLTRILNSVLLFLVLAYVYPMKFLFQMVAGQLFGASNSVIRDGVSVPIMTDADVPALFVVYGSGVILVYALFALLYVHVLRRSATLELDESERFATLTSLGECLIYAGVAALSMAFAVLSGGSGRAGLIYMLYAPAFTLFGWLTGRKQRLLNAKANPGPALN